LDKVRVGMIGLGGVGTWGHLPGYEQIPDEAKLVAFCDLNPGVVNEPAKRHGAKVYSDYNKMVEDPDIDVVDIALPHFLHGRVALAAAKAKKNVLCEKPFTLDLAEADAVIQTCKDNGLKLMVAENTRFVKAYEVARTLLDQKVIGDVCLVRTYLGGSEMMRLSDPDNWIGKQEKAGGGVLMDSGVHSYFLLRWMVGEVKRVFTAMSVFRKDLYQNVEDNAVVSYEFDTGAIGTSQFSNTTEAPWTERLEMYGTKGSLIVDMLAERPLQVFSTVKKSNDMDDWYSWYGDISWQFPFFEHSALGWKAASMRKEVQHFVRCVKEDKQPLVSGRDGRRDVEIALKALESGRTHQWVDA
jgi:UDP-N-acetyl-2-amino-2-deoxyglucuronate dehydrogenase